jgi:hypothetical protein
MSQSVDTEKFLPPEYPLVRVWCKFDMNMFQYKFHRNCPGQGTWRAELSKAYSSPADAFKDLTELKETMWCSHCDKGLFIPNTCASHADTDSE